MASIAGTGHVAKLAGWVRWAIIVGIDIQPLGVVEHIERLRAGTSVPRPSPKTWNDLPSDMSQLLIPGCCRLITPLVAPVGGDSGYRVGRGLSVAIGVEGSE